MNTAGVNGPKIERSWNPVFLSTKPESYYATIFRAAHHYYYKYIYGLNRPPQNSIWRTQLKLKAYTGMNSEDELINGTFGKARRFLGLASQIHVYKSNRKSDKIYGTVIHEIAHAAHWNQGRWVFHDTDDYVSESWARGVQWALTRMIYGTSYVVGFSSDYPEYTLVVVDMIDDEKNNTKVSESVSGYTLSQIENAMIGKKTWSSWRDHIKSKYNNSAENQLDALFSAWK